MLRKRALLVGEKGGKRKRKVVDEEDEEDVEFGDEEADRRAAAQSSEDEDGDDDAETAEMKRLRLAKAYISDLKRAAASDDEDDDDGMAFLSDKLRSEALEAAGRMQRRIADRVAPAALPPLGACAPYGGGRLLRGHRLSATAVALTDDDSTAFTVTKCGGIFQYDVETGKRLVLNRPGDPCAERSVTGTPPEWMQAKARKGSALAICSVAVSTDSRFLAVGGGDCRVHVWDLQAGKYVQGYKGHKDLISGLAFRRGSHQLFSCSFDRSVKLWSLDDGAYMDSLFGHQSEVTAVDVLRQERCVTAGFDRSCRVWKIPEETQMVYRSTTLATDCVKYVTGTEWVSGSSDGSVALWSQLKKKPVHIVRSAHHDVAQDDSPEGPGCQPAAAAGWVQSVAVCPGSDLMASGAGDGKIRLWAVREGPHHKVLEARGALPARGFVNGLAIAKSARFLVAAIGQEPRLGRWLRDGSARNGTLIHALPAADGEGAASDA